MNRVVVVVSAETEWKVMQETLPNVELQSSPMGIIEICSKMFFSNAAITGGEFRAILVAIKFKWVVMCA